MPTEDLFGIPLDARLRARKRWKAELGKEDCSEDLESFKDKEDDVVFGRNIEIKNPHGGVVIEGGIVILTNTAPIEHWYISCEYGDGYGHIGTSFDPKAAPASGAELEFSPKDLAKPKGPEIIALIRKTYDLWIDIFAPHVPHHEIYTDTSDTGYAEGVQEWLKVGKLLLEHHPARK